MSRIPKSALVTVLITALAAILVQIGALFYFYSHPEAVVKVVERSISRFAEVSIERLSYSLNPLHFRMEGISILPAGDASGFSLEIPMLAADLELEGPFWSKTLVIKRIGVDGFSLKYDQAEFKLPGMPLGSDSMFKKGMGHLAALLLFRDVRFGEIKVKDGKAFAALPDLSLKADGITAGRSADRKIEFNADARILLPSENGSIRIPKLHLLTTDSVSLSELKVDARLSATGASFESPGLSLSDVALTVEGTFDMGQRRLEAPLFIFQVADALDLRGNLTANGGRRKDLAVTIEQARLLPRVLMGMAPVTIRKSFGGIEISGGVSAQGAFRCWSEDGRWEYSYEVDLRLMKNPISYTAGDRRFGGGVEGVLTARGNAAGADVSADLRSAGAFYADSAQSVELSDVVVSAAGRHPEYRIENLSARILKVSGAPLERLPLGDFRLQARRGTVNIGTGSLRLPLVELESPRFPRVAAGIEADEDALRVRIDKGSGLIAFARGLDLIPAGWTLSGDDSFSVALTLAGTETLSIDSRFHFENLAFQDPGAGFAGEGIGLTFSFNGSLDLSDFSTSGTAGVEAASGELLYDLFYFDLKKHPFFAVYEGAYAPAGKQISLSRLELELEKVLSLNASGKVGLDSGLGHVSVNVPEVPIDPSFRLFVVEPFQRERPYLSAIGMGGRISADLEVSPPVPHGRAGWSVKGHIRWEKGHVSLEEKGFRATAVQLDYPVWYGSNPGDQTGEPIRGGLTVGDLKIGPVVDQAIRFEMVAQRDSLRVPAFPKIALPWGFLSTGAIEVREPYSEKRAVHTALSVTPLDMAPLLSRVWPNLKKAILQGSLDPVVIRGDRVDTRGELSLEASGGKIVLSGLGVDRLSTGSPSVTMDAVVNEVHLGPLTGETDFGKIEGVLSGHVRNLEIAYGQPQRFDLLLETVKRKGVPQKISIKAVENIARIGGGQSPFMGLAGAFTALFETLNYEKIGIRASLENDLFGINGTIVEGGQEFFIKGSLVAGVNIINQNPDNRIRFKDMVKRVQRVTSDTGKPMIE